MKVGVKYEGKRGGITYRHDVKNGALFVEGVSRDITVIADTETGTIKVYSGNGMGSLDTLLWELDQKNEWTA